MRSRPILALLVFAAPQLLAQSLEVTDVRFWSLASVTRIAIEANGEFEFRSDHIQNPERLFFDIVGAKPRFIGRRMLTREVGDKLLKRIRIAETQPGTTRVVLDLESPVDVTSSQLSNPDRLIVELRPTGSAPASPALSTVDTAISRNSVTPAPSGPPPVPVTIAPPPLRASASTGVPGVSNEVRDVIPSRLPQPKAPPRAMPDAPLVYTPPVPLEPALKSGPAPQAARRANMDNNRSLTRALGLKVNRVVIDAGHGGHDQGTVGPHGLLEKELVLDVALRLGKLIERHMGSEVIYTRSDDTFIPLEQRTAIANQKKADLFLSIHANSSPYPKVAGVETFYLNFTTSADALDTAARENAGSQKSVYELHDLIQTITLNEKVEESKEFAGNIESSLQSFAVKYSPAAKSRGIKKAPFVVLIGASMPSVLAEIGFLSNPREESLLKRSEHRQKLAEALYHGLFSYSQKLSHFEVASR